jgi:hypothetical protein
LRRYAYAPLRLCAATLIRRCRFAQDKPHRKDSFILKELCEAQCVYSQRPHLEAGEHTASLWVRAGSFSTGTGGRVAPGCWSSDYILVREYTPFGSVYLPGVTR